VGLLMFLRSFLAHEEFVNLLSIMFFYPIGPPGSLPRRRGLFGGVGASISSPVDLSPRNIFPFVFVAITSHAVPFLLYERILTSDLE
jgi:hypothetical protein